jgi:putative N6-adenine-specific DNA methylase
MMDLDGLPTRSVLPEYEITTGGLAFITEEHLGYQINFFSKLASRVLIRIHKFEARYFDQFEKELKKLDLGKWLEPQPLVVKIESHKSRLNNQKSIEEASGKILNEKKFKITDDESAQILFIRIEKDRVMVSLDTSGQHLHKRGYAQFRGEAPLRETLAAFVVNQLKKHFASNENLSLIDPFIKSGTLLFESIIDQTALLNRSYSWLKFNNRPKLFKSDSWSKNYRWLKPNKSAKLIGVDQDSKSILNLQKNSDLLQKLYPQLSFDLQTFAADSLQVDLMPFQNDQNLWLLANPPYGHRLAEGEAVRILERFEAELPLRGLAVLHPESWNFNFSRLKLVSKLDFKNQGLRLKLSLYSL